MMQRVVLRNLIATIATASVLFCCIVVGKAVETRLSPRAEAHPPHLEFLPVNPSKYPVSYPPRLPHWPNALALTSTIDSAKAARNIKPYDAAARSFYLSWKPDFANVSDGVAGWNGPDNFVNDGGPGDGFYIASARDPQYSLTCVGDAYCGYSNHLSGIHIPNGARTQNSGAKSCDCHLYVLEPVGWVPISTLNLHWPNVAPFQYEIDLENAANSPIDAAKPDAETTTFTGGGTIYATGAAAFSTGGTGWYGGSSANNDGFNPGNRPPSASWGGSATHGNSSYTATVVTAEDLQQGAIKHEMFLGVMCAEDAQPDSWPASVKSTDFPCAQAGGRGWSYGDHVWLQMSDAAIESSSLNSVQRVLARGLAHYGAVVLETAGSWGPTFHINITSGDPSWAKVAKVYGLPATTWNGLSGYRINMGLPFRYMHNMHAINSCVISRTC